MGVCHNCIGDLGYSLMSGLTLNRCFHQKPGFLNKTELSLVENFQQFCEKTNDSTVLFKNPGF